MSQPEKASTDIESLCAAKGMRMTEQRRVIARVLAEAIDYARQGQLKAAQAGR